MHKKSVRIALITNYYPPKSGVAVNRMEAFTSYLCLNNDFNISVFTEGRESKQSKLKSNLSVNYISSFSLLSFFSSNKKDSKIIHLIRTLFLVLLRKLPLDFSKRWRKKVLNSLLESHKNIPFDVIISSYAPFDPHMISYTFKKLYPEVKWICDMRDEMSKNVGLTKRDKQKGRNIELLVNESSDALLSVSKPILEDFKLLCPNIPFFEEVRNGFNHSFEFEPPTDFSGVLKFGYFGTFYGSIKPDFFFKAIVELVSSNSFSDFEIHLYGVHNNFSIPEKLLKYVFVHHSLTYEEAILSMNKMDANILLLPITERRGVYSGKLFDYVSVSKPIFACVDKTDVAADLINELGCGYVASFDSIDEIKHSIIELKSDLEKNYFKVASPNSIKELHRKLQVKKLERIILELLN
jgi:hypothetical protein